MRGSIKKTVTSSLSTVKRSYEARFFLYFRWRCPKQVLPELKQGGFELCWELAFAGDGPVATGLAFCPQHASYVIDCRSQHISA